LGKIDNILEKKPESRILIVGFLLVALALKMEEVRSSEMSVNLYQTTQCHIQDFRELFIVTAMRTSNPT
jgi:hypothetical protein